MEQELLPTLRELLRDGARLQQMRAAARALAQPEGAQRLAAELLHLAGGCA